MGTPDVAHLQRALEASVVGVLICDDKGKIHFVNKYLVKALGYTQPEDLLGKTVRLLVSRSIARSGAAALDYLKSSRKKEKEKVLRTQDGEDRFFETTCTTTQGDTIFSLIDITRVVTAEQRAALLHDRCAAILDALMQGVLVFDPQGNMLYLNKAAVTLLDMTKKQREHVSLDRLWDAYDEDGKKISSAQHPCSITFQTGEEICHRRIGKKNRRAVLQWFDVSTTTFQLQKERYVVVSFSDISKEHAVEEQAAQDKQLFEQAFSEAPIGIGLVSLEGKWLRVNKSLATMLGYSEEQLIKKTFQDITYPDDLEADLTLVEQVLTGEIPRYAMEKRYIHKNGAVVWARLHVSLVRDSQRAPLYFISQIEDISSQKKQEEEFTKTIEELERLNDMMIDRELKMVSLKKQLGRTSRGYTV